MNFEGHPPAAGAKTAPRCWIAVASAEHARLGCEQGFMQVCHGKAPPLKRLRAGDLVAYYAPAETMGDKDRLQCFVSIGEVLPGEPYAFDMGGGFVPFRRNVVYWPAQAAPIQPLLDELQFIENRQHWGYKFRLGLFEIPGDDMRLIALAMRVGTNPIDRTSLTAPCAAPTDSLPLFS